MKVLFVSEYFTPKIMGGGETNLELLTKALVKNGEDVSVLTSYHSGLKRKEEMEGVKVYRTLTTGENPRSIKCNFKRSIFFPQSVVKEVRKIVKKRKFDLIHFVGTSIIVAPKLKNIKIPLFSTIESYPALCPKGDRIYYGGKECKIKCSFLKFICCQHKSKEIGKMKNSWYLKYNLFFLFYVYYFYKRMNKALKCCNLIAISQYIKKILLQQQHQSEVVPNAIDVIKFSRQNKSRKKNHKKAEKVKILYIGALIKSKGPQVLLKAIKNIPSCHCDFYGKGVLKEELQKYINQHNIDATIHGQISYEKIPQVYAETDLVVFPSIWPEPFGRIAIEAMAAGKPIIGSAIGGIKETITKGIGLLFKPGDINQLREQITKMKNNERLQKEFIINGRKYVTNKYSELNVIKKMIKRYQEGLK